ncbi:hypothetical protein [Sandarakinorhabdus sp.]|uniref:hypothetical protein n=1 Tax=Sandarakinorhabdus sp. TaxID=1916663 RepID=UPI00333F986B
MKIAILLGDAGLETLIRARAMAQAMLAADPLHGGAPDITIGLPVSDDYVWKRDAGWLAAGMPGVTVRRLDWQLVPAGNALRMHQARLPLVSLAQVSHVLLPRDWGSNFTDCDAWLVMADPGLGAVYPIRPTAYFCSELAARRHPHAFCADMQSPFWTRLLAAFQIWRQAGVVVTTDPITAQDVLDFAGVAPDRMLHLPHSFDCAASDGIRPLASPQRRLIIRMEPDSLHDIASALRGLRLYRQDGGTLDPMIACEAQPEAFRRQSNVMAIAVLPAAVRDLLEDLAQDGGIERLTTPDRWARLLGRAAAVWSPRLSGQGSQLAWPLRFGLPLLCADHPAAREHAHPAAPIRYKPGNPDGIADALHALQAVVAAVPAPDDHMASVGASVGASAAMLAAQATLIVDRLLETADV